MIPALREHSRQLYLSKREVQQLELLVRIDRFDSVKVVAVFSFLEKFFDGLFIGVDII